MRRVLTITSESHPNTPVPEHLTAYAEGPMVWQVYIDGTPFLGVPTTEPGAEAKALGHRDAIIATGRYEYVDLRLRPERREGARREREHGTPWARDGQHLHTDPRKGDRRAA